MMENFFHKYTSVPLAIAAAANPVWLPEASQIAPWLSIMLQIGGGILIAVQIRYWWKKNT